MKLQAGNMESMDNDIVDDDDDDEDDDDDDDDDFMSEQNRVPCGFYLWWTVVTLSWKHIINLFVSDGKLCKSQLPEYFYL